VGRGVGDWLSHQKPIGNRESNSAILGTLIAKRCYVLSAMIFLWRKALAIFDRLNERLHHLSCLKVAVE
jgi:hypothetical protein